MSKFEDFCVSAEYFVLEAQASSPADLGFLIVEYGE
jgi:hypothetical protein